MKKKLVSILLATAMVLSLAACGSKETTQPEESTATAESSTSEESAQEEEAAEAVDGPLVPYEETVKLKIAVSSHGLVEYENGDDVYDNPWTRAYKERLNIEVEPAFVCDNSEYMTKIALAIAEKNLPDIFIVDYTLLKDLVEADMIQDLTDVYEQYACDGIKTIMEEDDNAAMNGVTFDGKLYAIPQMDVGKLGSVNHIWLRQDWMQEQNLSAPESIDDLINMARVFKEAYDCTPISAEQSLLTLKILAPAWGAYPELWVRDDAGQVVYGGVQPVMKEVLTEFHKWYEEGLLDPNFATMDEAMNDQDDINGLVGIRPYYSWWGYWPGANALANLGMESIRLPYVVPTVEGGKASIPVTGITSTLFTVVSKDCEHPEAAMKLLNFRDYVLNEGKDNESEEFMTSLTQGNRQHIVEYMRVANPLEGRTDITEVAAYIEDPTAEIGTSAQAYIAEINNYLDGKPEGAGGYTMAYPEISAHVKSVNLLDEGLYVRDVKAYEQPKVLETSGSVMKDILIEGYTKIIMGTEPIDYFDTLVEEWMAAGGEEATKEMNEIYGD